VQRMRRAAFVTVTGVTVGSLAVASPAPIAAKPTTAQAPVVLPAAKAEGVAPTAAGVRRALQATLRDPALGGHVGISVYDVSRRRHVYSTAGSFTPASTLKLLTTTAALAALGADHRFTTKVVDAGRGSVVLVGGGDPLLDAGRRTKASYPRRASLPALAALTVKALRAKGVRTVTLGYDATLFSGPGANPKWQRNYVPEGIAAPTTALWIDQGRKNPTRSARWPDPALAAAQAFGGYLKAAGIKVVTVRRAKAPAGAKSLAEVRSPTLAAIAEHVNLASDNDGAEALLRHVGLATGAGGSTAGGVTGLRKTLGGLGLDPAKARIEDGSGLSRTNAVPLTLLSSALATVAGPDHPELRPLLAGLPVAGFNGSLAERFAGPGTTAGSGHVRAKTGTLTGVHSLAGLVRDRTGTLLAIVLATDRAKTDKALAARLALDRAASVLANCGCG
jgi:serine-type D-Ala-D-Ala carboxypeptidase/endopeptidase (penicillin-binding protein 4)